MTQNEIAQLASEAGGHYALCIALVELCHKDIAKFARLRSRYEQLPELDDGQQQRLHRAAIDSSTARDFLQDGFLVAWARDAASVQPEAQHGGRLRGRVGDYV